VLFLAITIPSIAVCRLIDDSAPAVPDEMGGRSGEFRAGNIF
jgi:hypothetical protein